MILQFGYYLLSILGIIRKRSRILTVMMLFIMWIVFGLCTYNGDFGNYNWIYKNIQTPAYWLEFEPLFTALMLLCSKCGLNFIQFRMVFGGLFLLLLYYTIGKYTNNKAEVLGYYMLFPFLYFSSVIRSGIASILVILAFHEIIARRNNKIRFWVIIIIAVSIHLTSIFFIGYYFLRQKEIKKYSLIIMLGLVLLAFFLFYSGVLYSFVSIFISSDRTLKWFMPGHSDQESRWIVYLIILDFMIIILSYLSYRENKKNAIRNKTTNPFTNDVYYINIGMLIFIPTFFVTNASSRFLWEILLLNILLFAKDDELRFKDTSLVNKKYHKKNIILLGFLLFFSYYANMPYKGTVNDRNLVFKNNMIFTEPQINEANYDGYSE